MQTNDTVSGHSPADVIFNERPSRLLVVGLCPQALLGLTIKGVSVERVPSLAEAESWLASSGPATSHDNEVPCSLILQLDADTESLEQCLGRAVRAFPHRVLVHFQAMADGNAPADERFFALGFRRLTVASGSDGSEPATHWFEYRLKDYKAAPDWLNARFWANPERFNADEDPDNYFEESDDEEE